MTHASNARMGATRPLEQSFQFNHHCVVIGCIVENLTKYLCIIDKYYGWDSALITYLLRYPKLI